MFRYIFFKTHLSDLDRERRFDLERDFRLECERRFDLERERRFDLERERLFDLELRRLTRDRDLRRSRDLEELKHNKTNSNRCSASYAQIMSTIRIASQWWTHNQNYSADQNQYVAYWLWDCLQLIGDESWIAMYQTQLVSLTPILTNVDCFNFR